MNILRNTILFILLVFTLLTFGGQAQETQVVNNSEIVDNYLKLGQKELDSARWDHAMIHFEKVIDLDSNNVLAYWGVSLSLVNLNRFTEAAKYADIGLTLYKRKRLKKTNFYEDLVHVQCYSLLMSAKYEEAFNFIYRVIPFRTDNYYFYQLRAMASSKVGKLNLAYDDIVTSLTYEPNNSVALGVLGFVLHERNDHSGAISILEEANKISPESNLQNYFLLGRSYYALSEFEKSILNFEYFIDHPDKLEKDQAHILNALSLLGKSYMALGNYKKSATVFKQLVEIEGHEAMDEYGYGFSLFQIGSRALANTVLLEGIINYPTEGVFDLALGILELARKNNKKASEYFNSAVSKGTVDSVLEEFYLKIAAGFVELKDLDGVIRVLKKGTEVLQTDVYLRQNLLLFYGNDPSRFNIEIMTLVDELITLNENDPKAKAYYLAFKSVILFTAHKYEESYTCIDEAVSLLSYSEFHIIRSMVALFLTDTDKYRDKEANLQAILDDLDLALQSGYQVRDIYHLKAIAYHLFEYNLKACETINSVKHLMSKNFTKKEVEMFCDFNKKKSSLLDYNYNFTISTYDEFLDAVK